MGKPPPRPKIYHITHGRNLDGIIADGCLWSDEQIITRGGPVAAVGMRYIKKRRLESLSVDRHPGTKVGQYVPFYFCPRSVMLYILHMGNNPDLNYKEGQRPIVHLEADLHEVVTWADEMCRRWAFTDRNAGSGFFRSFHELSELIELDWNHIAANDFRLAEVKESKQAEFLVSESCPWHLFRRIGVIDETIARRVREIVSISDHRPDVVVQRSWYF